MDQKFNTTGIYNGYQGNNQQNKTYVKKIGIDTAVSRSMPNFWEGIYNLFLDILPVETFLQNINVDEHANSLCQILLGNEPEFDPVSGKPLLNSVLEQQITGGGNIGLPPCYIYKCFVTNQNGYLNISFDFSNVVHNPHHKNQQALCAQPYELIRLNMHLTLKSQPESGVYIPPSQKKALASAFKISSLNDLTECMKKGLNDFCQKFVSGEIAAGLNSIKEASFDGVFIRLDDITNVCSNPIEVEKEVESTSVEVGESFTTVIEDSNWSYDEMWDEAECDSVGETSLKPAENILYNQKGYANK